MDLNTIADRIAQAERDDYTEARLRAWFSNMLAGLQLGHVSHAALQSRIRTLVEAFEGDPLGDRNALHKAFQTAMDEHGEADHYERPQPINERARGVTFQSDAGGRAGESWLGRPAFAREIAERFAAGACRGEVGRPGKPLWIAPYTGELRDLCEEARSSEVTDRRRAEIVARVIAKLGLCHFRPGAGVVAFVTAEPIGQLSFDRPDGSRTLPVGPTIVEARTHVRFRTWSREEPDEPYGRTYDLDPQARATCAPPRHHGAREVTRPRLSMAHFSSCIYVGEVMHPAYEDDDAAYLAELDANASSEALLRQLAQLVPP